MQAVIDKIKALDLKVNPYDEAKKLIAEIQRYGLLQTTLHVENIKW